MGLNNRTLHFKVYHTWPIDEGCGGIFKTTKQRLVRYIDVDNGNTWICWAIQDYHKVAGKYMWGGDRILDDYIAKYFCLGHQIPIE